MLPERRIFGKKIHAAFIRSSFLSNGCDPAAGFRFKISPPSLSNRYRGSDLRREASSPLSHASPFFKPGNRWQAALPGFPSILSVQAERNIANAIQKQSPCLRNEVGIGDYRLGLRTAST